MSRQYNIKWRADDERELKRVVKNFNAKLTRLSKKDPEIKSALPERVSAAQLRSMIETRQDLNRELNRLKRFSQKGAEEIVAAPGNDYNLKLTKWQRNEMSIMSAVINRKRAARKKRLDEIELKSRGEKLGYKKGQVEMGKTERLALEPVKPFTASMNKRDLEKKFRKLMKESSSNYWNKRDEVMRANYLRSLTQNFNPEDIGAIVQKIEDMPFDQFRQVFEEEDLSGFEINYPPDSVQYEKYLSALRAIWMPNK